jgi:translocator protein
LGGEVDIVSFLVLIGFIGATAVAATTGAIFRPGEWYERLAKPDWRPPNWLFAPVWSLLYLMIAFSGWLVWRDAGLAGAGLPLLVYFLQLLLNAAWTPMFFGLHRIDLGFLTIFALWLSILATIWLFYPVSVVAAMLLVPYFAWVSFAALLNLSIWRLNRTTVPS